ncbi:hypothetical protein O6H91_Y221400 [Diphasiastrum complanatum]|nr:hypothetical protein O6H91_Y221400 [Diphasiastrum complanatum]
MASASANLFRERRMAANESASFPTILFAGELETPVAAALLIAAAAFDPKAAEEEASAAEQGRLFAPGLEISAVPAAAEDDSSLLMATPFAARVCCEACGSDHAIAEPKPLLSSLLLSSPFSILSL